ncbi:MAG: hypothetical protein RBU37_17875 [Myxococcota bacterium]|jgi:hypothetical protein|nr:hypothetical protein [Myxococcota bacterium]
MYLVAITQLASAWPEGLKASARTLSSTPYDLRLALAGGLPAIVATSDDAARAAAMAQALRACGHQVLDLDSQRLLSGAQIPALRSFQLETQAIIVDLIPTHDAQGAITQYRIPFASIEAIFPTAYELRSTQTTEHQHKKFSPGRAMLSSGMAARKTITTTTTSRSTEKVQACFVFLHPRCALVIRNEHIDYRALGERMAHSQGANYALLLDLLRRAAPQALFDDSLLSRKLPDRLSQVVFSRLPGQSSEQQSGEAGVLLLAQLALLGARGSRV